MMTVTAIKHTNTVATPPSAVGRVARCATALKLKRLVYEAY